MKPQGGAQISQDQCPCKKRHQKSAFHWEQREKATIAYSQIHAAYKQGKAELSQETDHGGTLIFDFQLLLLFKPDSLWYSVMTVQAGYCCKKSLKMWKWLQSWIMGRGWKSEVNTRNMDGKGNSSEVSNRNEEMTGYWRKGNCNELNVCIPSKFIC